MVSHGPLLFNLYMLGTIIRNHDIYYHSYADNTLLCLLFSSDGLTSVHTAMSCIEDINCRIF